MTLSFLVTLTWAAARPGPFSAAVMVAILVYSIGLAWQTRRPRRWRLEWDGSAWQLSGGARAADPAPMSGPAQVSVALDFGDALLLRATTDTSGAAVPPHPFGRRSVWLPLQRQGHAAQWHALRCALHSARRSP
jgi:hypothetical protein